MLMKLLLLLVVRQVITHAEATERLQAQWTVVHAKRRASMVKWHQSHKGLREVVVPLGTAKPTDEKIRELGKEMCKNRPAHPECRRFQDAGVRSSAARTAASEVTSTASPRRPAPGVALAKALAKAPTPKPQSRLPAQGFQGRGVRHADGETVTADWHSEYAVATPGPRAGEEARPRVMRSGAVGRLSTAASLALALALARAGP
mmetsp:Transcript_44120/g.140530  ORF Transcript_44120/g.140530 Transcript_44120/m.140530 type:complete len:204 (+) Transcript_44120:103-714(+)